MVKDSPEVGRAILFARGCIVLDCNSTPKKVRRVSSLRDFAAPIRNAPLLTGSLTDFAFN